MDGKTFTLAVASATLATVTTYFLLGRQKKVRAADNPKFQAALKSVLARLAQIKVVPVVAIDDAADAVPLAQALVDGGLPCAEITFRTAAAEDAIRAVAKANLPGMLIGAGTVLDIDMAQRAVAAGAHFLVAPGLNLEVVEWAIKNGVPIVPGVVTPSEIEAAMSVGLRTCKFFPAGSMGGLSTLKSIR
jgi:2-dehydro-3-deoxyphosphogluconate aldolase/(4S)-4-hydroxy-2-oxoglutarate aldolase